MPVSASGFSTSWCFVEAYSQTVAVGGGGVHEEEGGGGRECCCGAILWVRAEFPPQSSQLSLVSFVWPLDSKCSMSWKSCRLRCQMAPHGIVILWGWTLDKLLTGELHSNGRMAGALWRGLAQAWQHARVLLAVMVRMVKEMTAVEMRYEWGTQWNSELGEVPTSFIP